VALFWLPELQAANEVQPKTAISNKFVILMSPCSLKKLSCIKDKTYIRIRGISDKNVFLISLHF